MNFKSKRILLVVLAAALLLLSLCAWEKPSHSGDELKKLQMNPTMGRTTLRVDSRQGVRKTGTLKALIKCGSTAAREIGEDGRWQSLPLDPDTEKLCYEEIREIGKFLPETGEGSYLMINRNQGDENQYDFLLAVYSAPQNSIYYVEVKL